MVCNGIFEEALLDERNEQRAGGAVDFDRGIDGMDRVFVGTAGNGGAGADDADLFGFCGGDGGGGSRGDDALDGDIEKLLHHGHSEG